jgi:Ca2+-binding EF-hand superfamily protein
MRTVLVAVLGALAAAPPSAGAADILFPNDAAPARLRVEVEVDGRAPDVAWEAFLDKLFDHFDRDRDGSLSAAEAGRLFPLPVPNGREVAMDFAKLDADRDGRGSRAEFKAYYRAAGFAPLVVVTRPPQALRRRLGEALFRRLDRDGDGRLSRTELEGAPGLLRRLDENEDEVLTPSELLAVELGGPPPADTGTMKLSAADGGEQPDAVLRVALGQGARPPRLEARGQVFRPAEESPGRGFRFLIPDGRASVAPAAGSSGGGFRAAKAFYLAQFRDAVGSGPGVAKAALEQDPGLRVFVGLFDAADRDGDGRLTRAELQAFLDLVELGVGCQVVVTAEDLGRNLFDLFDRNQDGVLDLAELSRVAATFGDAGRRPVRRSDVPRQVRLSVARGPVGPRSGPVPVPAAADPPAAAPAAADRGPRWFRAMDRNGDGFVSPAEFVGPPDLFRKLDADGDGRISPEEAERAGR